MVQPLSEENVPEMVWVCVLLGDVTSHQPIINKRAPKAYQPGRMLILRIFMGRIVSVGVAGATRTIQSVFMDNSTGIRIADIAIYAERRQRQSDIVASAADASRQEAQQKCPPKTSVLVFPL